MITNDNCHRGPLCPHYYWILAAWFFLLYSVTGDHTTPLLLKEVDVERPVHGPALHNIVVTSGGHPGISQFLTKLSNNHRPTRVPVSILNQIKKWLHLALLTGARSPVCNPFLSFIYLFQTLLQQNHFPFGHSKKLAFVYNSSIHNG